MKNIPPTKVSFDISYSLYIFSPCPPHLCLLLFDEVSNAEHTAIARDLVAAGVFCPSFHCYFFFFSLCDFIQNCHHCVEYLLRLFIILLLSKRKLITVQVTALIENINLGIGQLFCHSNDCQLGQY